MRRAWAPETPRLAADPNGFFQISWGLWSSTTTGLERTGNPASFAGDTFELLEFDYFPNASPFFGGPFLSPTAFGVANPDAPGFEGQGSFANAAFSFGVEMLNIRMRKKRAAPVVLHGPKQPEAE